VAAVFYPSVFTLSNGLQIVVVPNHLAPAVTQMVWYKVGSSDEVPGKTGLAHYLEHLMFRGTPKMGPGEFSKAIAAQGGNENAFTSYDYTAFFETIAADRLPMIMQMEADRMQNLQIVPATATPELSVVLNERQQRTDNSPEGRFDEMFRHNLLPGHPYGTPVIGWKPEIEKLTAADAVNFYHAHYAPNNAVVIISGDVDPDEVHQQAEQIYGVVPKRDLLPRVPLPASPLPLKQHVTMVDAGVEQPQLEMDFIAPSYATQKDLKAYAFEVLAEALDGGEIGALYRNLVTGKAVASGIGTNYDPDARGDTIFTIAATPRPGKTIKALDKALQAELKQLVDKGIDERSVESAKLRLQRAAIFARDGLAMPGYSFGMALTTGHTVDDVEDWPDRIKSVTTADVNAALRYLASTPNLATGELLPDTHASRHQSRYGDSMIKFFGAFAAFCVLLVALAAHATTIQEVTSPGGIKAWLVQDDKLPLISMHFAFRGGVEQDPVAKQGLANLTMDMLTEGAGPYSAAAFQQELADHAIAMNFSAGRDSLTGSLKCLASEKDKAFQMLNLALTQSHFDQADIARVRDGQLTGLRTQLANPGWQARYILFQNIFGSHPYGERRLGSLKTLAALTREDITGFAAQHLGQDNLLVAVAGDITPDELAKNLDSIFGALPKTATLAPISEIIWPKNTAKILAKREGTQTDLLFVMPGPKRDSPDWYAAEIANYILGGGGFSSRLMQDVREKKGLTYGIDTGLSPMDHGALIVGEAAVDNPNAGKAWAVALDTMQRFYRDGVSDADVGMAKDYLTGELPLAMTSTDKITGVLSAIQQDKLGRDYLDHRNDMIRAVSLEDVNRAIHQWFNPDGLTLSMVGKPDGITPTQTRDLVRD
jgi:predicted Zn-dependent peptidase